MPLKPTKRGYKVWFKSWFEIRLRIPIWSTPGKKTRVQVVLVSASVSSKLLQNHSSLPTRMSLSIISSRPCRYWITCVPRTYLQPVQFVQIAVICQWWPEWTTQWHVVKPNGARETVSAMWSGRIPRWYMWCPQHSVRTPCWMQSAQKDGTSVPQSVLEYTKCMGGVDGTTQSATRPFGGGFAFSISWSTRLQSTPSFCSSQFIQKSRRQQWPFVLIFSEKWFVDNHFSAARPRWRAHRLWSIDCLARKEWRWWVFQTTSGCTRGTTSRPDQNISLLSLLQLQNE